MATGPNQKNPSRGGSGPNQKNPSRGGSGPNQKNPSRGGNNNQSQGTQYAQSLIERVLNLFEQARQAGNAANERRY